MSMALNNLMTGSIDYPGDVDTFNMVVSGQDSLFVSQDTSIYSSIDLEFLMLFSNGSRVAPPGNPLRVPPHVSGNVKVQVRTVNPVEEVGSYVAPPPPSPFLSHHSPFLSFPTPQNWSPAAHGVLTAILTGCFFFVFLLMNSTRRYQFEVSVSELLISIGSVEVGSSVGASVAQRGSRSFTTIVLPTDGARCLCALELLCNDTGAWLWE
jgi:hypothetical protein